MKKRLFSIVLMLCILLSMLPIRSNAVMTGIDEAGGWVVGVGDTGTLDFYIIKYKGTQSNVTVPTKVAGHIISGIDDLAFMGNTTMKTLNVPDGMTVRGLGGCNVETVNLGKDVKLSSGAFANCHKLKTVNFPDSLTSLPARLFENCTGLTSITIPSRIRNIGQSTFEGCTGLTSVTISEGVQTISQEAFRDCSSLTSVTLPNSITSLGIYAFSGCSALQSINIPAALTNVDLYAFQDCGSLEAIPVASKNPTYYNDADGNLCTYNVNSECEELIRGVSAKFGSSYTLPSTTGVIGKTAFSGSTGLKTLVIPGNIRSLNHRSFANCTNLTEIRFEGRAPGVDYDAFLNVTADVYYPGDLGENGGWSRFNFSEKKGNLTWIPYCSGIHTGTLGKILEESTCSKAGSAEAHCSLCGKDYIASLPLADHAFGTGVVKKPATCTATGLIDVTCTECGHSETQTLEVTAHNFDYSKGTVIEKNTCSRRGVIQYICKDCHCFSFENTPKKNHGFEEGVCRYCGNYVIRVFGADRYQTAFKVADELKSVLGVKKFQNIIVASGTGFADALAGSYLAAVKNAPILLVRGANVDAVKDYIKANLAPGGTVYLLGGVNAVPEAMESGLDGFSVKRLGGANRYDTNLLILQEAGVAGKNIIVCTGLNFADSLSASAVGLPILLVKDGLYANQKEFLKSISGSIIIVGGTNAVNSNVEKQLSGYGMVSRLAGNTRYDTSILIADRFFNYTSGAVLAYAQNFPDGLCGGPLAYNLKMPLILTASGAEELAADYLARYYAQSGYILGGTGLIRDGIAKKVLSLNADELIYAR